MLPRSVTVKRGSVAKVIVRLLPFYLAHINSLNTPRWTTAAPVSSISPKKKRAPRGPLLCQSNNSDRYGTVMLMLPLVAPSAKNSSTQMR